MNNKLVEICGEHHEFQGVTDLELIPLIGVFGTEPPPKGTKEREQWNHQFAQRFAEPSTQRAIAIVLLCAFPTLPESTVKYTVRRLPDGTEECRPGRDLRVRLTSQEFERVIDAISPELEKMQQTRHRESRTKPTGFAVEKPVIRVKNSDTDLELTPEQIKAVQEVLLTNKLPR